MLALKEYLRILGKDDKTIQIAIEKFELYRNFLLEQNSLFNLTSITDPHDIVIKHFVDSLAALDFIKGTVLDIGSGAGFPSVPLAIMSPECSFTMVDSLKKRVDFLNSLSLLLKLENAKAVHSRAEDLPKNVKYDVVVARAVSELNTLCEYCIPFVKKGGHFIAYKSNDINEELKRAENALAVLGGEIYDTVTFKVYSTDIIRKLVVIKKTKDSPLKYPRDKNKPKKQPL